MLPISNSEDQRLLAAATDLLDRSAYEEASKLLNSRVAQGLATATQADLILLAEIAGLLIDIGSEGCLEAAVKSGLTLLEANREHFDGFLRRSKHRVQSRQREERAG